VPTASSPAGSAAPGYRGGCQKSPASSANTPPHRAPTGGDTALKQLAGLLKARRGLRAARSRPRSQATARVPYARAQHVAARRPPTPRRPDPRRDTAARKRGARRVSRSPRDRSPSQHEYRSSRTSPLPAWVRGPYPGQPHELSPTSTNPKPSFPNETSRRPSAGGSRAPSPTPATSPTSSGLGFPAGARYGRLASIRFFSSPARAPTSMSRIMPTIGPRTSAPSTRPKSTSIA
jgi:hypothetical protein